LQRCHILLLVVLCAFAPVPVQSGTGEFTGVQERRSGLDTNIIDVKTGYTESL